MKDIIISNFRDFMGDTSFVYKNLVTGESFSYNSDFAHVAASIIKVPIMVEAFVQMEKGILKPSKTFCLKDYKRVPPAGVLTFMSDELLPTTMDLIYLMIVISDNMATNMLIDTLNMDRVNLTMKALGLKNTSLERKLFDSSLYNAHKRNRISVEDMSILLELMYKGELVSKSASCKMLEILRGQQLNDKIPMLLPLDYPISHKTGDIEGSAHDVGIVFAKEPFIACFAGSNVDTAKYNRLIGETSKILFDYSKGIDESLVGN